MQSGATDQLGQLSSLHLPHSPRIGSHHLHSQIEPATILGPMWRFPQVPQNALLIIYAPFPMVLNPTKW